MKNQIGKGIVKVKKIIRRKVTAAKKKEKYITIKGNKLKTLKKSMKTYMNTNNNNYDKYEIILKHFEIFFKESLELQDKIYDTKDEEKIHKYDVQFDKIIDKLHGIEIKEGSILLRIKRISPDIYELLGLTKVKIPDLELVDTYYKLIHDLINLDEGPNTLSSNIRSDISIIQLEIIDNLIEAFLEKKKERVNINEVDNDLMDMFSGFSLSTNANNVKNLFSSMKI